MQHINYQLGLALNFVLLPVKGKLIVLGKQYHQAEYELSFLDLHQHENPSITAVILMSFLVKRLLLTQLVTLEYFKVFLEGCPLACWYRQTCEACFWSCSVNYFSAVFDCIYPFRVIKFSYTSISHSNMFQSWCCCWSLLRQQKIAYYFLFFKILGTIHYM